MLLLWLHCFLGFFLCTDVCFVENNKKKTQVALIILFNIFSAPTGGDVLGKMVQLHVKNGDESQFLFSTSVDTALNTLIQQITDIYNGRLKVDRICSGTF